ncbi:MAG: diguanylate cyclase [Sedimenticola sp.]
MQNRDRREKHAEGMIGFVDEIAFPTTMAALVAGTVFLLLTMTHAYQDLDEFVTDEVLETRSLLEHLVASEAKMLTSAIHTIEMFDQLVEPFLSGDRSRLYDTAEGLYRTLRQQHQVTHFYFHNLDQTNYLRVHSPSRHGDLIERYTMKTTAATKATSTGLELGPLGTFTLRVVKPWIHESNIIGYLELGLEIDHLFTQLHDMTGINVAVQFNKEFLNKRQWNESLKFLGQGEAWGRYPEHLLLDSHGEIKEEWLKASGMPQYNYYSTLTEDKVAQSFPLVDAYGRKIGRVIMGIDTAILRGETLFMVTLGILTIFSGLLMVVFISYRAARKVEIRLNEEQVERKFFQERSRKDGLTELLNQQEFYQVLERELRESKNRKTSLSLLMMDVDHFKLVNDQHGHRVGDCVLRSLAQIAVGLKRGNDYLARYGGEEFTVILGDTNKEQACEIAERIREAVSKHNHQCDSLSFNVTVSLGVATFPDDAQSVEGLVEASDTAMYQAKRKGRNRVEVFTGLLRKGTVVHAEKNFQ